MKRRLAFLFLFAILVLAAGSIAVLRTSWAGDRLCELAGERVRSAANLPVSIGACRVEPFRLEVVVERVVVGPPERPVFTADALRARLAALQVLGGRLHLDAVTLVRPRVRLDVPANRPEGAPAACPPPILSRVDVRRLRIEEGALDLRLGEAHVSAEGISLVVGPSFRRWRTLATGGPRRLDAELEVGPVRLRAGGRDLTVDGGRVSGDFALDFSRARVDELELRGPGWELAVEGAVEDLCAPRLDDVRVEGRAPLPLLLALAGKPEWEARGTVEAKLSAAGPLGMPAVKGEVRLRAARIGSWIPGDATARLALEGRELRVESLELPGRVGGVARARGVVRFGERIELDARADLDGVELAEVLERCKLPRAWVAMRVTGQVAAKGTVRPLALEGSGALDLRDFRSLSGSWEAWSPGAPTILDFDAGRLESRVEVDGDGVHLTGARLSGGRDTLSAEAWLWFKGERGFHVDVDGGVDLDLLRHLSSVPIGGRAQVKGTIQAAPYGNPRIETRLVGSQLRFLRLDLGDAEASASYGPADHVIHVLRVDGRKGETRWGGDGRVDLGRSPVHVDALQLGADGRLRDLFDAVMPWLPSTKIVRDALDGAVVARAEAHGPAPALEAQVSARLGEGTLLGRAYDSGELDARVLEGARADIRKAELRRGDGSATARGTWGFAAPFPWSLEVAWAGLSAQELVGDPSWSGAVDGTAALRGSLDLPDVVFEGRSPALVVSGLALGAAEGEGTLRGEALALDARAEGLELTATATARGEGPFQARARISHDDLARVFGAPPGAGLRVRARGHAQATGVLARIGQAHAEVRLDELAGSYADVKVASRGPVLLTADAKRLVASPFKLGGSTTDLAVSGVLEPDGGLGVDVSGNLDLRLLAGAAPRIAGTRGQLALSGHVGGTLAQPSVVGTGHVRDGGFQLRDAPVVFSGLEGDLSFSQNSVLFDGVTGAVNGGRAVFSGEVELRRLVPARLRIAGELDAVPLRIPEFLPTNLSGDVRLAGTWDEMLLSGRLHVNRARYTERVDLERSILEFRRRPAAARPYDPAGEWLRFDVALVVDGDARVENDLVRASLYGELALTGTMAAPGLVGTLKLQDGARGTFRGNEFVLTQGVVDFTDRRAIAMNLDVNGETQVREYQIFMHVQGPYESPALHLSSQPALSQQDIITLLSLGFTTRDAAVAGGVGGAATAAAAQALFSVSGLDAQVRRFLPEGGPLRDFTVRMTSTYSEGTGQVEPRAEFESKLLAERLRLRWQAPLSGARGQRAQAEMRLGGRTSLQYQWDNDNPDVATGGDHGLDLKFRWEWND